MIVVKHAIPESGQIWTFNSTKSPAPGFQPSDILIREKSYPLVLFKWIKSAK